MEGERTVRVDMGNALLESSQRESLKRRKLAWGGDTQAPSKESTTLCGIL